MKIVVKTNIKDNPNVTVVESIKKIHELLLAKGAFVLLTRVNHSGVKSPVILTKSCIKMVKQEAQLKTK